MYTSIFSMHIMAMKTLRWTNPMSVDRSLSLNQYRSNAGQSSGWVPWRLAQALYVWLGNE
jgi:hypothetical protein